MWAASQRGLPVQECWGPGSAPCLPCRHLQGRRRPSQPFAPTLRAQVTSSQGPRGFQPVPEGLRGQRAGPEDPVSTPIDYSTVEKVRSLREPPVRGLGAPPPLPPLLRSPPSLGSIWAPQPPPDTPAGSLSLTACLITGCRHGLGSSTSDLATLSWAYLGPSGTVEEEPVLMDCRGFNCAQAQLGWRCLLGGRAALPQAHLYGGGKVRTTGQRRARL